MYVYGGFKEKQNRVFTEKSPTIRTASGGGHIPSVVQSEKAMEYMLKNDIFDMNKFFKSVPYKLLKELGCVRYLHPVECERLQTITEEYTAGVSNAQRYKQIGNAWTIDVVAWILTFLT